MIGGVLSKLSHNAVWNLLGSVLPMAAGLIAIPLLIHTLGTERFGLLTLVWSILGYFSLFDMGIGRATTKYVALYWSRQRLLSTSRLVRAALLMLFVFGSIAALLLMASAGIITRTVHLSASLSREEFYASLMIMAATLPLVMLTAGLRGTLEGQSRFRLLNVIKIPASLTSFVVPLLLLPFTHRVDQITLALAATRLLVLLAHAWVVRSVLWAAPWRWRRADRMLLRRLMHYGGWVFVATGVGTLMSMGYLDRLAIGWLRAVADLAYYATPMEIILRLLIIPGAIASAMFPYLAAAGQSVDTLRTTCARSLTYIGILCFPFVILALSLGRDALGVWIGPAFAGQSAVVLDLLMLGVFFNALAHVPYTLLQATGHPRPTALRHVWELPFYVPVMLALVYYYGVNGAAFAWMAWAIIDMVLLFWLARREMGYAILASGGSARPLLELAGFAIMAAVLAHLPLPLRISGAGLLLAGFVIYVWKVHLSEVERGKIRTMYRTRPIS